jgi:hypothetical protein
MPSRSDNFRTIAGAHSGLRIGKEPKRIFPFTRPVMASPSAKLQIQGPRPPSSSSESEKSLANPDMERTEVKKVV